MRIDREIKSGREYRFGNEVLRYKISLPVIEGCEDITRFYSRIGSGCESFCKGRLAEESQKRCAYALDFAVPHVGCDELTVLIRARLICEGRVLEKYVGAHTWSLSRQRMLTPSYLKKRYSKKRERHKKGRKLFLENGELRELSDTNIDRFFKEY